MIQGSQRRLNVAQALLPASAYLGAYTELPRLSDTLGLDASIVVRNPVSLTGQTYESDSDLSAFQIGGNIQSLLSLNPGLWLLFSHFAGTGLETTEVIIPSALTQGVAKTFARLSFVTYGSNVFVCVAPGSYSGGTITGLVSGAKGVSVGTAVLDWFCASSQTVQKKEITFSYEFSANPLCFELEGNDGEWLNFIGSRINTLTLEISPEPFARCSWDIVSSAVARRSSAYHTSVAEASGIDQFSGSDCAIVLNSTAGITELVTGFSLALSNGIHLSDLRIGEQANSHLTCGKRDITGTMEILFEDLSLFDFITQETLSDVHVIAKNRTGIFSLIVPDCRFYGKSLPDTVGPRIIRQRVSFRSESPADYSALELAKYIAV